MTQMIKWLYLVTLAVWVGSIIFYSAVVARTLHRVLKPDDAAALARRLFPQYYLFQLLCAASSIVCLGLLLADRAFAKWPGILSLLLVGSMGATVFWLRQTVVPQMNELRDRRAATPQPDPALDREWKELHRLTVQLNAAVLLCGLALLFLVVYARVA